MEPDRERYRKLPGHRRGFIFGRSVWMGSDHLLLVKSARFREEYRRFYFRDIQAIVTAKAPRFHLSTRAALIALLWCMGCGFALAVGLAASLQAGGWVLFALQLVWWAVAAALVIDWICVSAFGSCRCRIYTAVSSEDLPSLYRTWTARRFLARVEPFLAQAQGTLEGNWAEAADERQIGPVPVGRIGLMTRPGAPPPPPPPPPPEKTARTPISYLFVALLCLGGLADLLTTRASLNVGRSVLMGFLLPQVAAAAAVIVQNYQGRLRNAMRILAIDFTVSMAAWYYASYFVGVIMIGFQAGQAAASGAASHQPASMALIGYPLSRGAAGGIALLLGLAGVVLMFTGERPPEEKISFNV